MNDRGGIVDKSTGEKPPTIIGFPFPKIDPPDPHAGVKVLWNYNYMYYNVGNSKNVLDLIWVSLGGVERSSSQEAYFLYYDGQKAKYQPAANPQNLLVQFIATMKAPQDVYGTTEGNRTDIPEGGWRETLRKVPTSGFDDPNWNGVPWAPIGPERAKRKMWIIEGVPRDKYYLYGKIQLYIDEETFQGAWNRKFSWSGGQSPAIAIYLDEAQLFRLTAQLYMQSRVRMEDSDGPKDLEGGGTQPKAQIGHLIQWRNYAFPVLEGSLKEWIGHRRRDRSLVSHRRPPDLRRLVRFRRGPVPPLAPAPHRFRKPFPARRYAAGVYLSGVRPRRAGRLAEKVG